MHSPQNYFEKKGRRLRIFLDHRCISLMDHSADVTEGASDGIRFTSQDQIRRLYENFEKDTSQKELNIWESQTGLVDNSHPVDQPSYGSTGETGLIPAFLSLFTIVEAAGGLVKNEEGEWLFIFRRGKWDLPKGKLSGKESTHEAALREVQEETGIRNVIITKELPVTYHIYYHKGRRILKPVFWFEMIAPGKQDLIPETKEDIEFVEWVPAENLPVILSNTYASIREIIAGYGYAEPG
jgi:8-oxo-dGTP pyrophosphatase MutT (NUDIX family)